MYREKIGMDYNEKILMLQEINQSITPESEDLVQLAEPVHIISVNVKIRIKIVYTELIVYYRHDYS